MPGRNPPWVTPLTYFKHDARHYQIANRNDWSHDELKHTIETIWRGDAVLRAYYQAHVNSPTLPGFPAHMPDLPQFPYQEADVHYVKANRTLPPERDTNGNPIGAVGAGGPGPGGATSQNVANPAQAPPDQAPSNSAADDMAGANHPAPAALALPTHAVSYAFDWWPPQPWHAEPADDYTSGVPMHDPADSNEELARFELTKPYMWPEEDENNWHGVRFLGSGSFGCAGLWVQVDEVDNITDCMAVKESKPENSEWRDPLWWRDRLPLEIRIHQRIDQNTPLGGGRGHRSLVEHRGYRLMMRQRRFRLYMKYYEGGSLRYAVYDNFQLRAQHKNIPRYAGHDAHDIVHLDEYGNPPEILPEGFIWWILRNLVDACQLLHFGQALDVDGAKADWQPIPHLDIRMDNILLQPRPRRPDGIRPYPHVVLVDYGIAIYPTSDGFPENTFEFLLKRHDAKFAPEHWWLDSHEPAQLDDKTDIWQIACVIFELMANGAPVTANVVPVVNRNLYGKPILQHMLWPGLGQMNVPMDGNVNAWPHEVFPTIYYYNNTGLPLLIRRCLKWNRDLRPTLVELRKRVDEAFSNHPEWEHYATIRPVMPTIDDWICVDAPFPHRNQH